jgi:drug/metabolite transporter (DMT)-like permease
MQRPSSSSLPSFTAATNGILVGSAIVATRYVIDQSGPASVALLRYSIGFCCMLPLLLMSRRIRFERRDLLPIGLLGITQFGILIVLMNYALQFIPSARTALIFATMPLLTMILAAILGYEKVTWPKTLGVLLTIVGVGFALGEKAMLPGSAPNAWIGEAAVFASALSGAVCSILYRPYLRKYPTLQVSSFAMLASVGFLALLATGEGFFGSVPSFTTGGWLAILFIGANSGIGYYLWLWSLNHADPTRVTVFLALSPIVATGLGALFLGEVVSTLSLLGVAFVVLGLWLAHQRFSS